MTVTVRHSSIDLWAEFPDNKYVQRLLKHCRTMNIKLAGSPVREQWFYHPEQRTIYVWPPDLDLPIAVIPRGHFGSRVGTRHGLLTRIPDMSL